MYSSVEDLSAAAPVTVKTLREMRENGEKIACLTAYDASFAQAQDLAGVDVILVGDSLGMVIQGEKTTVGVSTADIAYHARAVSKGLRRAFMMADMPFMSYATLDLAIENATALMQQGHANMIKLEGGEQQAEIVEYLSTRGIPVCAHVGLCPQLIHKLGGFKVQGREEAAAAQMLRDAKALTDAGADLLLVECVPAALGRELTEQSPVPVIGIGAGSSVDGQILVMHDLMNVLPGQKPRFVRDFSQGTQNVREAFSAYVQAVKSGSYPAAAEQFFAE
ncbi:MAG: 3-methyl-2-oxobutanoate hydroxymethyltransferase [Gammaproteobacteria bacterium]|nr:3-methyl-2-oxobutanoate hydroxymethyltransferase [Gammaproteobacteria bacterium]